MLPMTLLELARRHANIAGVKESSGDFNQFSAILRDRGGLPVLVGRRPSVLAVAGDRR